MGCQFQSGLTFTPALPAVVWLWDQPSAKLSVRQTGKKNTKKASPSVESRKEWPFVNRVFLDQSSPFLDGVFVVFSGTTLDITWIYFFCRSSLKNILCICVHICIYISYIYMLHVSQVTFQAAGRNFCSFLCPRNFRTEGIWSHNRMRPKLQAAHEECDIRGGIVNCHKLVLEQPRKSYKTHCVPEFCLSNCGGRLREWTSKLFRVGCSWLDMTLED